MKEIFIRVTQHTERELSIISPFFCTEEAWDFVEALIMIFIHGRKEKQLFHHQIHVNPAALPSAFHRYPPSLDLLKTHLFVAYSLPFAQFTDKLFHIPLLYQEKLFSWCMLKKKKENKEAPGRQTWCTTNITSFCFLSLWSELQYVYRPLGFCCVFVTSQLHMKRFHGVSNKEQQILNYSE